MFKVNNKDTTGVFIVNFEHISHLALVFILFTLNIQLPAGILYTIIDLSKIMCILFSV